MHVGLAGRFGLSCLVVSFFLCACDNGGSSLPSGVASYCVELKDGDSRTVLNSDAGLLSTYRLGRNALAYEAALSIRFVADDANVTPAMLAEVESRTAGCFEAAKPYLGGPGGERLIFKLAPPTEGSVEVRISSHEVRGHWRLWRSTWACPQLMHEVLHLYGLVDEYEEPELGQFDCRAVGPTSSMMSFPGVAYEKVSSRMEVIDCSCEGADDAAACRGELDKLTPASTACPAPSAELVTEAFLDLSDSRPATPPGRTAPNTFRFFRKNPGLERASLLLPAQFNAIAHPGCGMNRAYYRCALDAYRTSPEKGGKGCLADRPASCSGGSVEWLTKTQEGPDTRVPGPSVTP